MSVVGWNWTNSMSLRGARCVGHADAAARVDQGVGGVLVNPPVAAGAEERSFGAQGNELTCAYIQGHDAVALAVINAQGGHKPFRIDLDPLCDGPFIEGVEQHMPGYIGGIAGSGIAGAAEGALGDRAVGKPAEGASPMLHLIDDSDRLFAHDLHGVLIGQVIAPFDGVEGVFFPGIVPAVGIVGQGRVEASLRGDGMGSGRVDLGDQPHVEPVAQADGRPESRQTAADNQNIVLKHARAL